MFLNYLNGMKEFAIIFHLIHSRCSIYSSGYHKGFNSGQCSCVDEECSSDKSLSYSKRAQDHDDNFGGGLGLLIPSP